VFYPMPRFGSILGHPGVGLHALAQRTLDCSVADVLATHSDLVDVLHEVRDVLEVGPIPDDVLLWGLYLYGDVHALSYETYSRALTLSTRQDARLERPLL
jgi:hypothetical protein